MLIKKNISPPWRKELESKAWKYILFGLIIGVACVAIPILFTSTSPYPVLTTDQSSLAGLSTLGILFSRIIIAIGAMNLFVSKGYSPFYFLTALVFGFMISLIIYAFYPNRFKPFEEKVTELDDLTNTQKRAIASYLLSLESSFRKHKIQFPPEDFSESYTVGDRQIRILDCINN